MTEEIKSQLDYFKDEPKYLRKVIDELEQENNAYKQSEQEATEIIAELKEYSQRMENQRENYYKEYNKLRSALEEIKHILEFHKDELEECLHNDIDGMIQNKINEVLG